MLTIERGRAIRAPLRRNPRHQVAFVTHLLDKGNVGRCLTLTRL